MIVVFTEQSGEKAGNIDFIVFTSIYFASTMVDGPIVPYSKELNLSNVMQLACVGHGSIGAIRGVGGDAIGQHLVDETRGINRSVNKMIFLSCFAGREDSNGNSLITRIAAALKGYIYNDLTISGYTGPSIKNSYLALRDPAIANFLAEMFNGHNDAVVAAPGAPHKNLTKAKEIQASTLEENVFEKQEYKIGQLFPSEIPDRVLSINRGPFIKFPSAQKPTVELAEQMVDEKSTQSNISRLSQLTIKAIAEYNADKSSEFFRKFIEKLHAANLLFKTGDAVASVSITGRKRKAANISDDIERPYG